MMIDDIMTESLSFISFKQPITTARDRLAFNGAISKSASQSLMAKMYKPHSQMNTEIPTHGWK